MEIDCIHFKETGYFSPIVLDYLNGSEKLRPFYQYQPQIDSFKTAIENKKFERSKREVLYSSLMDQYKTTGIKLDDESKVKQNLDLLKEESTFTVTTGHQLNLFTGPLYFVYKIVSAINLAKKLSETYTHQQFVPIYWMASEDHDFEEISHFRFAGKKIKWNTEQSGAVGRMKTAELESVFQEFSKLLTPYASNAEQVKKWFKEAYLNHENLAQATRYLAHELFAEKGLVIVDGDDLELKRQFIPYVKEELESEISSAQVATQSEALGKEYKLQVNPREINLFYLTDNRRDRIEKVEDTYHVVDTDLTFSKAEILSEVEKHPEKFSPNVLLRPLYQEVILPNLAYIGGGGELAYWFQLKSTFEHFKVPFPMLLLRNSVMWMDEKQSKYFADLKLSLSELFEDEGVVLKKWVKKNAKEDLELKAEINAFQKLYEELRAKSKRIDQTLDEHVGALAEKQKQSVEQLSEKLIRAERKKSETASERIHFLKSSLYPNRGLQERADNFSELYIKYGNTFIETLLKHLSLPSDQFMVIKN